MPEENVCPTKGAHEGQMAAGREEAEPEEQAKDGSSLVGEEEPWFGLRPPKQAVAAWGARLLFTQRRARSGGKAVMTVEALWDRQQAKQLPGHDTEFAVLSEYIEHALGDIEKLAKRDGLWSEDRRLVRFQFVYRGKAGERDIHIEIDPRASHGYLYSCVWV